MRLTYTLTIDVPDELDADTLVEIEADASAHDVTLASKVARYIGGDIDLAWDALAELLPDGWDVRIAGP